MIVRVAEILLRSAKAPPQERAGASPIPQLRKQLT